MQSARLKRAYVVRHLLEARYFSDVRLHKVKWKDQNCFIFGRRSTGRMDLRLLNGTKINASVGYKNLKIIEMRKNYLTEQEKVG